MDVLPVHVESWLQGYEEQIDWLYNHPDAALARKAVSNNAISPLLGNVEWSQDSPYNMLCPGHCLTGCVATAMAQIMYYHRWPEKTMKEIPGYTTQKLGLSVDNIPIGPIDWDNILPSYSDNSNASTTQKQAVADLMLKCGTALQMDYDFEGSGASVQNVAAAMIDYFDYDASATYIRRSDYGMDRWNKIIYDELAAGRPVCYGGQSFTKGGHAFVIDGYDAEGYYHVNWGWGGRNNGYFLLNILDPYNSPDSGYQNDQEAVIGIQKNTGVTPVDPQDGELFTAETIEGVNMTFKVISAKEKTCQVGNGESSAINREHDYYNAINITIPSFAGGYKVVSMGAYAITDCYIDTLSLPNTLETIGRYAIQCNIHVVKIPASVTSIEEGQSFGWLRCFVVDEANPIYGSRDGILYNKDYHLLMYFPSSVKGEFTIPEDIVNVNSGAFRGIELTKLTFPKTVTWVGESFVGLVGGAGKLKSVVWEAAAGIIPQYAFHLCPSLTDVELLSASRINSYAFSRCENMERLKLTTQLFYIAENAFKDSKKLREITISYNNYSTTILRSTISDNAFEEEVYQNAILYVPTGSGDFFKKADGWKKFRNIVEVGAPIPEVKAEGDIWGYHAEEFEFPANLLQTGGIEEGGDSLNLAIFIPGSEYLKGATITSIRIPYAANSDAALKMAQGTAWLAESLDDQKKTRVEKIEYSEETDYREIVLSEPYTITEKGVYVGMTCPMTAYCQYQFQQPNNEECGFYYVKNGQWQRWNGWGLILQVRVKDHHLPKTAAHFEKYTGTYGGDINYTSPNNTSKCVFTLFNDGQDNIESIDYTITIDGKESTGHLNMKVTSGMYSSVKAFIDVTGPAQPDKVYTVNLKIDKVNGMDNPHKDSVMTAEIKNISRHVERRTVMEEGTGTWCPWSPSGIVGMGLAKERFGERVINVSIHSNDPMDVGVMDYVLNSTMSFAGTPSCHFNRIYGNGHIIDYDPYSDLNVLEDVIKMETDVDISVKGVWNADRTQVIASSELEFLDKKRVISNIHYYLVADELWGTTSGWYQSNGYSGEPEFADDPYLSPYVNNGSIIYGMTYHDVAVAGKLGKFISEVEAGEKITDSSVIDLPTGELGEAVNRSHLYVVAIITNGDGVITNAAKIQVTDPVTVTAKSYTRVYGDENPAFEYEVEGAKLDGKPEIICEATATSPVGEYPIIIKKGSVTNNNDFYVNGTLTITKAPLAIKVGTYTKKQDEENPEFKIEYDGFKNGESDSVLTKKPSVTTNAKTNSKLGDYEVTVSGAQAQNYDISYESGVLTIIEADPVIVTANSYTIVYGDPIPVFEYTTTGAPLVGKPEITCYADAKSSVGTYVIYIEKGSVKNYNDSYVNGTLTITKAPLTVTAQSYTRKQGEQNPEFEVSYEGFVKGETEADFPWWKQHFVFRCDATEASEPGEYDIVVFGTYDLINSNYKYNYVSGKLTVTEADPVVIKAKNYTRVYGEENPDFEYEVEGAELVGKPYITCEAGPASQVGSYAIVPNKGGVMNYNDSYVNGELTVTKAPLTVTAKSYTRKQGEKNPEFAVSYDGFKNYESSAVLKELPIITCDATEASEPGEYDIVVSGGEAENYEFKYVAGKLTVTEADAVKVTAKSYTRFYGDENPTFEYDVEGAALYGMPEISCEATEASPVGTYPIVITKGSVKNYNDTYVNGVLTVTKAPLTITVGSYTKKQYDAMPEFAVSYEGFVNGETEAVLTKLPTVSCEADKDSKPGEYVITLSGAEAENYAIQYVAGKLTVLEPDGINNAAQQVPYIVRICSVGGKPRKELQKGVNIVVMSDGTTRKVVIK